MKNYVLVLNSDDLTLVNVFEIGEDYKIFPDLIQWEQGGQLSGIDSTRVWFIKRLEENPYQDGVMKQVDYIEEEIIAFNKQCAWECMVHVAEAYRLKSMSDFLSDFDEIAYRQKLADKKTLLRATVTLADIKAVKWED